MPQISAHGRTKVSTLRKAFKEAYGIELRVYNGARFADESHNLASIRKEKKSGEISINGNMLVGNLEKKFMDVLGVKVQVEDAEGNLAGNNLSLSSLAKQNRGEA